MKVKELIAELQKENPEDTVFIGAYNGHDLDADIQAVNNEQNGEVCIVMLDATAKRIRQKYFYWR